MVYFALFVETDTQSFTEIGHLPSGVHWTSIRKRLRLRSNKWKRKAIQKRLKNSNLSLKIKGNLIIGNQKRTMEATDLPILIMVFKHLQDFTSRIQIVRLFGNCFETQDFTFKIFV